MLDDARCIQDGLTHNADRCPVCLQEPGIEEPDLEADHHDECAVRAMTKIVAVLEAADSLVLAWDKHIQGANSGSDAAADAVNAAFMRLRSALED